LAALCGILGGGGAAEEADQGAAEDNKRCDLELAIERGPVHCRGVGERVQNPEPAEQDARLLGVREQIEPRKGTTHHQRLRDSCRRQNFPSVMLVEVRSAPRAGEGLPGEGAEEF
jgi:hypothetical protein